eukprot:3931916-Rhodomonas_salina.2
MAVTGVCRLGDFKSRVAAPYATCGTDLRLWCYAICLTDLWLCYYAKCDTDVGYARMRWTVLIMAMLLDDVRYWPRLGCYASATRCAVLT